MSATREKVQETLVSAFQCAWITMSQYMLLAQETLSESSGWAEQPTPATWAQPMFTSCWTVNENVLCNKRVSFWSLGH